MIQANNICLSFGEQTVFDDVSFTIDQDQRIGLVGRNGSGKSTLLKAIAKQQQLDSGSVSVSNKKVVAYMPQEVVLESDKSILDETLTACADLATMQAQIDAMDEQLAEDYESVDLDKYSELLVQVADMNPARISAQAQQMLLGLGFTVAQMQKPVSTLSVGWKMRVVLAKLLLQNADFYLFDEPTNHLDIVAKDWFLYFLKNSKFGFMLVSHERYFLDKLCTEILEVERGNVTFYKGNYSKYVVQKAHDLETLQAAYVQQQKELKQKKETIERFRASANRARMAQSMIKAVDKIERIVIPPSAKTMIFNFPPVQQPGRIVLEVENVGQRFGDKQIFSHATFQVERGDKVAIIAPNGVGKTTLFNTIIGALKPSEGTITFGHNVTATIFAQDQTKSLDVKKSVLENATAVAKKAEGTIRQFLGSFLFSNDDVHKKVGVLSGGEKNRVGMVCVLLQDANLLLLDEPTNHLDIPSKEILVTALKAFKGTILFVSHDHDFINALATRIVELTPTATHNYIGNYDSYLYQKKHNEALAQRNELEKKSANNPTKTSDAPQTEKQQDTSKQIKKLESKIEKLESNINQAEHAFTDIAYGTPEFNAMNDKLIALKEEHANTIEQWEALQSKQDA